MAWKYCAAVCLDGFALRVLGLQIWLVCVRGCVYAPVCACLRESVCVCGCSPALGGLWFLCVCMSECVCYCGMRVSVGVYGCLCECVSVHVSAGGVFFFPGVRLSLSVRECWVVWLVLYSF